jgi:hypothetical protein
MSFEFGAEQFESFFEVEAVFLIEFEVEGVGVGEFREPLIDLPYDSEVRVFQ